MYMNCGIIAVAMGIILSVIGNFLGILKSIIGKILSKIGQCSDVLMYRCVARCINEWMLHVMMCYKNCLQKVHQQVTSYVVCMSVEVQT